LFVQREVLILEFLGGFAVM